MWPCQCSSGPPGGDGVRRWVRCGGCAVAGGEVLPTFWGTFGFSPPRIARCDGSQSSVAAGGSPPGTGRYSGIPSPPLGCVDTRRAYLLASAVPAPPHMHLHLDLGFHPRLPSGARRRAPTRLCEESSPVGAPSPRSQTSGGFRSLRIGAMCCGRVVVQAAFFLYPLPQPTSPADPGTIR